MTCERIQSLISAYVDGELPGVEMLELRQHMGVCTDCKVEYDSILMVKRAFVALGPVNPTNDLAASISQQIDASGLTPELSLFHSMRKYFSGFAGGMKLVATGAALFLVIGFLGRMDTTTPSTSMVYNPPYANALVHSFDQKDPIRVFYVPSSEHSGTLVFVPASQANSKDLGIGAIPAVPVQLVTPDALPKK